MTKHLRYLRNEAIEEVTAQRIREYESKTGVTVTLPVPLEQIIEQALGLDFDWDVIEELPGMDFKTAIANRHGKKSDRLVEVLLGRAATDPRAAKLLKQITDGQDTAEQKSAVDRYQSALLMPDWLMREAAANLAPSSWSVLYELANTAQVTISNLFVRLRRLDLIYMRDGDKTIYGSHDEFTGQKSLF